MIGTFPAVFEPQSAGYFSNSTGSFITNCRFSPIPSTGTPRLARFFIFIFIKFFWGRLPDFKNLAFTGTWGVVE